MTFHLIIIIEKNESSLFRESEHKSHLNLAPKVFYICFLLESTLLCFNRSQTLKL